MLHCRVRLTDGREGTCMSHAFMANDDLFYVVVHTEDGETDQYCIKELTIIVVADREG